jgi:hypothetical protein
MGASYVGEEELRYVNRYGTVRRGAVRTVRDIGDEIGMGEQNTKQNFEREEH